MNKEESKKARKVMEAWENGAEIEVRICHGVDWKRTGNPSWDFAYFVYRIAKPKAVELEVGMVLITDDIENQERVVQAIYGKQVCYILHGLLFVNSYVIVSEEFSVLLKGKLHPIQAPEQF